MRMRVAVVTGSVGLVGSECVRLLCESGWKVIGIDSNARPEFSGDEAFGERRAARLAREHLSYHHYRVDIRDRQGVRDLIESWHPALIIHTAGEPSDERAAAIPHDAFDVNAVGTLNLLVATRDFCPESPFCFTSTNNVYGERLNFLPLIESETRYEYPDGPEVYNMGGGRRNNISVLETIDALRFIGCPLDYSFSETHRKGNHVCYISKLSKIRSHFQTWKKEYTMKTILEEMIDRKQRQTEPYPLAV